MIRPMSKEEYHGFRKWEIERDHALRRKRSIDWELVLLIVFLVVEFLFVFLLPLERAMNG